MDVDHAGIVRFQNRTLVEGAREGRRMGNGTAERAQERFLVALFLVAAIVAVLGISML